MWRRQKQKTPSDVLATTFEDWQLERTEWGFTAEAQAEIDDDDDDDDARTEPMQEIPVQACGQ